MAYEMEGHDLVYNHKRAALDSVSYELDKIFEWMTDKIYDEEGEFHEDWSEGNQARWRRVFSTLEDAKTGLYSIGLGKL